jgi:hypothetical protein
MKSWSRKIPSILMNQVEGEDESTINKLREVAKSELHKVAA